VRRQDSDATNEDETAKKEKEVHPSRITFFFIKPWEPGKNKREESSFRLRTMFQTRSTVCEKKRGRPCRTVGVDDGLDKKKEGKKGKRTTGFHGSGWKRVKP